MSSEDNPVDEPSGEYNRGANSASRIFKEYIDTLEAENTRVMAANMEMALASNTLEAELETLKVTYLSQIGESADDKKVDVATIKELRQKVEALTIQAASKQCPTCFGLCHHCYPNGTLAAREASKDE